MAKTTDVVVVGGGVIGLSVAYELLLRDRGVLVLEKGEPGGGATRVSAGMLAPISEAEREESERLRFALDSKHRYPEFVRGLEARSGLSCGYRTEGTLWVAVDRDEEEELDHLEETLTAKSLPTRRLDAGEVLEREPHLSGRVRGGLYVEEDHQLDPRLLTRCLVEAVRQLGGEIRTGFAATEIAVIGRRVGPVRGQVDGSGTEDVGAEIVVLAAGAWSTEFIRSPLSDLGVRPVRGQMIHLRGARLLRHIIRTPHVYFVPREDGELLVGTTMEEQGFQDSPTAGGVLDILRHAWQVLPGLYELDVAELSAGFRPAVRDHWPVIGPAGPEGLFAALGHFRSGVLLAPATAVYLAETIVRGLIPPELAPFGVERLRSGPSRPAGATEGSRRA